MSTTEPRRIRALRAVTAQTEEEPTVNVTVTDVDDAPVARVDEQVPTKNLTVVGSVLVAREADRRPIIPNWMKSRAGWVEQFDYLRVQGWHALRFHTVRLPWHITKTVAMAPAGVVRGLGIVLRWVHDDEGKALRAASVSAIKYDEYKWLSKQRNDRVRARSMGATAGLVVLLAAGVYAFVVATREQQVALLALTVIALAKLGTPADRRLYGRAVASSDSPRLSSDTVTKALLAIGNTNIVKGHTSGGSAIAFPAPITRDGPGWRADVDLPQGVTWQEVAEKRTALASALRRPVGCVWLEGDIDQHPGRLVIWVGDRPMSEAKPPAYPLLRAGQTDLFKPIPFGFDHRLRPVSMNLMFTNVLIGSMPRYGKTYALRVLLLAAALDPTVELRLFELKGTGDLSDFEQIAYRYAHGAGDDALIAAMGSLQELYNLLIERADALSKLPRALAPEFKVTPSLAARRSYGLYPIVIAIDECQELFSNPILGKEAERLCTAIIKRGPALGIMLLLATQRPDKNSLPTAISANAGTRFCLRVMGHTENDMVLGTGASKNGFKAYTLSPKERGIGYLAGVADEPFVARTYKVDGDDPRKIVDRARILREAAGTLAGHALGEAEPEPEDTSSVLVDVLGVWDMDNAKASSASLAELLGSRYGDKYLGWDGEHVTRALVGRGIPKRQVWVQVDGKGANRQGFYRADVADALQALTAPAPLLELEDGEDE